MMVRVDLYEIRIDETGHEQIVVLKERNGNRLLPIVIGFFEAQAIQLKVNGIDFRRPMTHDLLGSVFRHLGAKIERVVVNNLEDTTFYARIHVEQNGNTIDIDARPSDAIALAVRENTPIYVEEKVFEAVMGS
jgi:hypothetical protein